MPDPRKCLYGYKYKHTLYQHAFLAFPDRDKVFDFQTGKYLVLESEDRRSNIITKDAPIALITQKVTSSVSEWDEDQIYISSYKL